VAERVRASRLERIQFFAPLRYETVFVLHRGRPNLERGLEMNSFKKFSHKGHKGTPSFCRKECSSAITLVSSS
jgi:hypothetical protein